MNAALTKHAAAYTPMGKSLIINDKLRASASRILWLLKTFKNLVSIDMAW
jgi:hypothetical protein